MAKHDELVASIVATTADYRTSDSAASRSSRVNDWIEQFAPSVRLPILGEMDHVLKKTHYSGAKTRTFLSKLLRAKNVVGEDPRKFWRGVKFLQIQSEGASQKEMLALFGSILEQEYGLNIEHCGANAGSFVYLDDAIFSAGRVSKDLATWITKEAPDHATVYVIVIAAHRGSYYKRNRVTEAIKSSGKSVIMHWKCDADAILEDRKAHTDGSDVLRPTMIPNDAKVEAYMASLGVEQRLRNPGRVGCRGIFSSEEGRHVLEQEFLKAGVRIREMCPNLNEFQRPLGNTVLKTSGFGSIIVTFRNCPNNAPLALWAGDPWQPLFPRTTNSATSVAKFMAMLAQKGL
jgi:hypothetical protein